MSEDLTELLLTLDERLARIPAPATLPPTQAETVPQLMEQWRQALACGDKKEASAAKEKLQAIVDRTRPVPEKK